MSDPGGATVGRHIVYGASGTAALAVATVVTFAMGRSSPPPPAATAAPAAVESQFDESWKDAAVPLAIANARIVPITRITPTPAPVTVPPIVELPNPKEVIVADSHVGKARPRNICERNHMRKVMTSKYGWRCRK